MSNKLPTPEEIQKMLRELGVKEDVSHTGTKGNWPKHIQPEVLELCIKGKAPAEYPEWWKKHANGCNHCQSIYKKYNIPLD